MSEKDSISWRGHQIQSDIGWLLLETLRCDSIALVHLASRSLLKTEELVVVLESALLW